MPRSSVPKTSTEPRTKKPRVKREWVEETDKWEGWRDIYFIGTEWEHYDMIFNVDWDFSNLEEALVNGPLKEVERVYLFGQTEPQMIEDEMVMVPTIIAVTSKYPPTKHIVLSSVQSTNNELVPMSDLKMSWGPYIESGQLLTKKQLSKIRIHTLQCKQRTRALKALSKDKKTKFQEEQEKKKPSRHYLLPLEYKGQSFDISFDWKEDKLEEIVEETMEDNFPDVPASEKPEIVELIKTSINTAVEESKANQEAEVAAKNSIWDAKTDKEKEELTSAKFYKFYPVGPVDVRAFETKFIGRYCPEADFLDPEPVV
ncbi:hypothetical protein GEMRC1_003136 [Eukaryota sp. GEM-RC1]